MHNQLFVRSRDSKQRDKRCRVCRASPEKIPHLAKCSKTRKPRYLIHELWDLMGLPVSETAGSEKIWLLGLTNENKPLGECQRALLALYWRVNYKHLTLQDMKKTKYHATTVCKDLGRVFMSRILAYQSERRRHFLAKKHAGTRNGRPLSDLHPSEAMRIAPIGELDIETGKLKIRKEIKQILKDLGVWRKFR